LQLLRKRPSKASCAVAAANCSLVAMPASTTSKRGPAHGGNSWNKAATACSQLAPKRVRRTKPRRMPLTKTTLLSVATMLARTARWARPQ
jgi:hypothetical protein